MSGVPPARPIRPLGAFELAALAELHAACFEDAWDEAALAALLAMPGAFALIAEADRAGGFVIARAAGGEAEILSLGVRPDLRRRGLGRSLLQSAIAEAAGRGASRLYLEVAADNWPARALYLANGFAQVGRRPDYYRRPGAAALALVLAKDIGSDTGSAPV
jgi:[ribosomal protein S18]-alanine N-acetyltransferase